MPKIDNVIDVSPAPHITLQRPSFGLLADRKQLRYMSMLQSSDDALGTY